MSMCRLSRPALLAAAVAALLAGCASPPTGDAPAPVLTAPPGTMTGATTGATAPAAPGAAPATVDATAPWLRPRARWVPVDWSALPGWHADRAAELWPALRAGCARPLAAWAAVCARAQAFTPPDDGFAREFLQRELQPWRVESHAGEAQGLATGYFEPLIAASRRPTAQFKVPLYRAPADLATRRPYWTRQQLDTLPAARAALAGLEIAWVASPLDALVLQIQGSGRLLFTETDARGTRTRQVRLAFAGHNDQPYKSVGRWLIEQGEMHADGANWPAIRAWGERAGATRLNEMLWSNPRMVFFREEPLPDEAVAGPPPGPRGAQGVPLTAGRSVAVDPQAVPYGTPLWLDTTEPLAATPLQRLVMAQDTGGAIVGAVRIDLFWGAGGQAEQQAGRMKQPLRVWALWPRGVRPPG